MLPILVYLALCRSFELLTLLTRSDAAKDPGILVLTAPPSEIGGRPGYGSHGVGEPAKPKRVSTGERDAEPVVADQVQVRGGITAGIGSHTATEG